MPKNSITLNNSTFLFSQDIIAGFLYTILILAIFYPFVDLIDNFNQTHKYAPLIIIGLHLALGIFSFTLDTWSTSRGDTAEILGKELFPLVLELYCHLTQGLTFLLKGGRDKGKKWQLLMASKERDCWSLLELFVLQKPRTDKPEPTPLGFSSGIRSTVSNF